MSVKSIIVGVDYGEKYSGLAKASLSEEVIMALPWKVIETSDLFDFIIGRKDDIFKIIIGKSMKLSGEDNRVSHKIHAFYNLLKEKGFNVEFEDERFTSQATLAEQRWQKRRVKTKKTYIKRRLDAGAAVKILQSYLDKQN